MNFVILFHVIIHYSIKTFIVIIDFDAGEFNYQHTPGGMWILNGRMTMSGNSGPSDKINVLHQSLVSLQ